MELSSDEKEVLFFLDDYFDTPAIRIPSEELRQNIRDIGGDEHKIIALFLHLKFIKEWVSPPEYESLPKLPLYEIGGAVIEKIRQLRDRDSSKTPTSDTVLDLKKTVKEDKDQPSALSSLNFRIKRF